MGLHPHLDVLDQPDLALSQLDDRPREIGSAGDLVSTLAAHSTEADTDLVCAHQVP
jgi:hypothetical protein